MPQEYASNGDVTIPEHQVVEEGQTLSLSNIGQTELDYLAGINSDANLWAEFQDWVALLCIPPLGGLGRTPVTVMFRLRLMIDDALRSRKIA